MLFAAVDIGSNSIRHLLVNYHKGTLQYRESSSVITRITGSMSVKDYGLSGEGVSRTLDVLSKLRKVLDGHGVEEDNRFIFATESMRQTSDPTELGDAIKGAFGKAPVVLSGEEEAMAGFAGTAAALPGTSTVFDLGGGSIEIASPGAFQSFPLGAVRLSNSFGEDRHKIEETVSRGLSGVLFPKGDLAGIGGTSSSAVMMLKEIKCDNYHPSKLHGVVVRKGELEVLAEKTASCSTEERKIIPGLEPGRMDIIVAGISAICAILEAAGTNEYTHSECGVMWGMIVMAAERRGLRTEKILF